MSRFADHFIERLHLLDPSNVQGWITKLVREKGILDTIFKNIHEGILIIDHKFRIHFSNNAAVEMLGLPSDHRKKGNQRINRYLKGLNWQQLLTQDMGESYTSSRQEIEIFYPTHRYLQVYLFPYNDKLEEKNTIGKQIVIVILHDITEIRNKTETFIESEKKKTMTMLAAGVAHEIGNPLNSLTIHLQLLDRYFHNHDESLEHDHQDIQESIHVALDEVKRLDSIVSQFLKAVRPLAPKLKNLSIKQVLSETIQFMRQEIENRNIFIECLFPKGTSSALGDAVQLKQAFHNIIKNAIEAMTNAGVLKITLKDTINDVVISFVDNGEGITDGDLGDIFKPYFTTKPEGSGLGLMIVERIINNHGGKLKFESKRGVGTTVTVTLKHWRKNTNLLPSSVV